LCESISIKGYLAFALIAKLSTKSNAIAVTSP
jgi:hypothetical protein